MPELQSASAFFFDDSTPVQAIVITVAVLVTCGVVFLGELIRRQTQTVQLLARRQPLTGRRPKGYQ